MAPQGRSQGNADAQAGLGVMYTYGRGVPQNDAQAVAWLRKAAAQGNAGGEGRLGEMYVKGQGVPQDYAQAHMWLRKGAEQGNSLSQDEPRFSVRDRQRRAARLCAGAHVVQSGGVCTQDAAIATSAQMRDLVAAKMTPAQIAEAQKMASEWVPKK